MGRNGPGRAPEHEEQQQRHGSPTIGADRILPAAAAPPVPVRQHQIRADAHQDDDQAARITSAIDIVRAFFSVVSSGCSRADVC